jgi:hypothetical protein
MASNENTFLLRCLYKVRVSILRLNSKKGGEPIFVNIRIKNEKGI